MLMADGATAFQIRRTNEHGLVHQCDMNATPPVDSSSNRHRLKTPYFLL